MNDIFRCTMEPIATTMLFFVVCIMIYSAACHIVRLTKSLYATIRKMVKNL